MESKLKAESKKPQLLYKLFLRGYRNTNGCADQSCVDSNPVSCIGFNKLSHRHQSSLNYSRLDQEQELRYTRRQRQPEDAPEIPGPEPPNIEIVELVNNDFETDKSTEKPDKGDVNHLLSLKWTCETLDKRREQITRYFQSQILKQKSESDAQSQSPQYVHDQHQSVTNLVHYCDYSNYNQESVESGSESASTEPIYAEICSDNDNDNGNDQYSSSISSFESFDDASESEFQQNENNTHLEIIQELSTSGEEDAEHLYENIEIVRHQLANLQEQNKSHLVHPVVDIITGTDLLSDESSLPSSKQKQTIPVQPKANKMGDILVDEESIIENKPAIKHYWETKMRESAASQFARSNFGVPNTTIIDKINDEIREDYMRNLELQDEGLPQSSASDTSDEPIEFDSFDMASSSNNSSPFGQPHDTSSPILLPESPTLIDSGHQSQESHSADHDEDGDNQKDENVNSLQNSFNGPIMNGTSHGQKKPLNHSYSYGSYTGIPKLGQQQVSQDNLRGKPGKVVPTVGGYKSIAEANRQTIPANHGKIENHVTHYITFNKPLSIKVKPIDDPSATSTATTTTTPLPLPVSLEREKSPSQSKSQQKEQKEQKEVLEEKPLSLSIKPSSETTTSITTSLKSPKADISYLLATSRLKKEIEDNLKREKELKAQGRVRTLSVDTVQSPTPSHKLSQSDESLHVEVEGIVEHQKRAQFEREKLSEEPPKTNFKKKTEESPSQVSPAIVPPPKEPVKVVISIDKPPTNARSTEDVNKQQKSPTIATSPSTYPNFKIGKNFNSLERYIMYSSMTKLTFRSMPPAWTSNSKEPTSPNANNAILDNFDEVQSNGTDSTKHIQPAEEQQEEESEPEEKVRKHYVPAEKKIKEELLEMVQREEELKQTRQQWKSTPNLSNLNLSDDEEPPKAEETVPTVQRRQHQAPRWGVEKRRRSALISKWEDMISKNNPQ